VKKRTLHTILALMILLTLSFVMAAPASADTVTLKATGAPAGNEDRIVVPVAAGTTLGDITSISWLEMLVAGYPPHVDIILDLDNDGNPDDALVFEYAYNNMSHYYDEAPPPYGAIIDGNWYYTFSDDGNGPTAVTDTSYGWLTSGASGPPIPGGGTVLLHTGGTLAQWKAGAVGVGITAATKVLCLEIEVDSWIVDSEAQVKSIVLNAGSSVGMTVNVPDIVAISVCPASIDFGTLVPGQTSAEFDITVMNIGTHDVDVDAAVSGAALFTANLQLRNVTDGTAFSTGPWVAVATNIAMAASEGLKTRLPVPGAYTPTGTETATLVFTATGSP